MDRKTKTKEYRRLMLRVFEVLTPEEQDAFMNMVASILEGSIEVRTKIRKDLWSYIQ